jgi:hypothetical protein
MPSKKKRRNTSIIVKPKKLAKRPKKRVAKRVATIHRTKPKKRATPKKRTPKKLTPAARRRNATIKQQAQLLQKLAKQLQVERLKRKEERTVLKTRKKKYRQEQSVLKKRIVELEKSGRYRQRKLEEFFKKWRKARQKHEVFSEDAVYERLERLWKQGKARALDKILYQLAKQYGLKAKDVFSMWMSPK